MDGAVIDVKHKARVMECLEITLECGWVVSPRI